MFFYRKKWGATARWESPGPKLPFASLQKPLQHHFPGYNFTVLALAPLVSVV